MGPPAIEPRGTILAYHWFYTPRPTSSFSCTSANLADPASTRIIFYRQWIHVSMWPELWLSQCLCLKNQDRIFMTSASRCGLGTKLNQLYRVISSGHDSFHVTCGRSQASLYESTTIHQSSANLEPSTVEAIM